MAHYIGTQIKKIRKNKKITQAELAEKIGYSSQQSIARIENSDTAPRVEVIAAIADALDVSVQELLGNMPPDAFMKMAREEWEADHERSIQELEKGTELLHLYSKLNTIGKRAALHHLEELTQIRLYRK